MESISAKILPPIFKMSVLCNILPYYGHIHRWRRLLEKISTETKEIWDQNWEQLMYIGRDFKREIELDNLNENVRYLRPSRNWLDLFSLTLSDYFNISKFDFTTLKDNLSEDEVIIVDSHDDIFKGYQIHFWRKDIISDILPSIKCSSFKSETKIFSTSDMEEIGKSIDDQNHTKSIVIESTDEGLSLDLVYGDSIKIAPLTFYALQNTIFFDKLKERYKLWEIGDCVCKPKKIRVLADDFENFINTIEELEKISNINDAKLGVSVFSKNYNKLFSKYDTMVFNHSTRWMSDIDTNFMFSGDSLAVVYKGNHYNFRLDKGTKESGCSYIKWKI